MPTPMYLGQSRNAQRHRLAYRSRGSACACTHPAIPLIHRRLESGGPARRQQSAAAPTQEIAAFQSDNALEQKPLALAAKTYLVNLRLFDGQSTRLQEGLAVQIDQGRIAAVLNIAQVPADATTLDCRNKVLMPGLIDAHWHSLLCSVDQMTAMMADPADLHLIAAKEAERTLLRGFTSVRDAGGPSFSLKRGIDMGLLHGPRIYPSGAMIAQTGGHADFRMRYELPRTDGDLSHVERAGVACIADGADQVLRRVREQLMLGASQIKLMAGGGVTSLYDPLEGLQFSDAELRAAVGAAQDWGTYVMVHVYCAKGIQRAVKAGVRSIEHGQLADEETARIMAGEGVWWSLQPFLGDEDANTQRDPRSQAKQQQVATGTVRAYELAQKHQIQTAWGTDILFSPQHLPRQGHMLAKLTRFYDPLTVLKMATGDNGRLLQLSGLRNPYEGELGVIKPGALADLLLIDGDIERNLDFLDNPAQNLRLIIKNGHIYKNSLR
ncbi:metal-dependent hydrolase family protein [Alcaligenes sp. SDU_A2]|uniref:metal-dependent hydrolase family protein n=1 Tax=Alcaligenes sp. SDU_A2 TaxID=3136634 RepID=UPI00311F213F